VQDLASGGKSWSDTADQLRAEQRAADREPALKQVVEEIAGQIPNQTEAERPAAPSEELTVSRDNHAAGQTNSFEGGSMQRGAGEDLSFLGPPRKPEHLGRLGHYDILQVIGKGGMGIVFKAFDDKLHRVVAIKVLAPELAVSGNGRKRFSREARAAAAIRNDHVIAIHAVEDDASPPYLVMEFIEGTSLQEKLDHAGPLGVKESLRIGMQMAEGLAAAHKLGLVHRDIKPANILLENGVERVKITDFGLARAVDDASVTQSGVVAGTPMYMAPEQAAGERIDYRADLFSLGSVLYAMCTGRPPFRASGTMGVLKRVMADEARPIKEINPDVPDWLCDIVARLHAKKPEERLASAKEAAELLRQSLAHLQQPQVFSQPPIGSTARRASKGISRKSALAAAAALLLIAGALSAYLILRPREDTDRPAGTPVVKGTDKYFDALKRENIAKPMLALAGGGDPDQAPPELVAVLGEVRKFPLDMNGARSWPACSDDGKLVAVPTGDNILLCDVQTGQPLRVLKGHTNRVFSVAFSHGGKLLASGAQDTTVRIWDTRTGKSLTTCTGHNALVFSVAFSPDDHRLLTGSGDGTGRVWEVETGKELFPLQGNTSVSFDVAFSPNGKHLLTAGWDTTVRVWNADTGEEVECLKGHSHSVQRLAFSPNRKLLASGSEGEAILWDTDTWKQRQKLPAKAGWLAFAPDGQTLLAANHNTGGAFHQLTRWDLVTGKELASFSLNSQGSYGLYTLSPDGKTLFATRDNPDVPYVRTYDTTTGKETPLKGHQGRVMCVAVSSDGKLIASGGDDHTVRLWDLANWKPGEALPPIQTLADRHTDRILSVAFSPDGKLLASRSLDGTVVLSDRASGKSRTWHGHPSDPWSTPMCFSPDSRTLASAQLDGNVKLWDVAAGQEKIFGPRHKGRIRSIAFSPKGDMLALGGQDDHTLQLWDVTTLERGATFGPIPDPVLSVAFSPDGKTLAWTSDPPDAALRLADLATKKVVTLKGHRSYVNPVVFHPAGRLVATGSMDGTVRIWDRSSDGGRVLTIGLVSPPRNVALSPEGGYLVTANDNGTISILTTPAPPKPYDPGPPIKLPDPVELAKRSSPADGLRRENIPAELLARAGGGDPQKAPAELVAAFDTNVVRSVAISPDGKTLAVVNQQNIDLWNLADSTLRATCQGHSGEVFALAFSPDGKLLASDSQSDGTVRLWDAVTGMALGPLRGPKLPYSWGVAFSPDNRLLASSSHDGTLQIWDVAAGRIQRMLRGHTAAASRVAFSPDGKLLASGGDRDQRALLWDVATGWQRGDLRNEEPNNRVIDVAFSPDGRSLAITSDLRTKIWDLATRQARLSLPGHVVAFRPDGELLALGCADGIVRLAAVGSEPPRGKTFGLFPNGTIHKVAFTPEGRYLATANPDGTVYVLRLAERGVVFRVPGEPTK
jgi:WD40 repeat protein/serine/threonine protein kinase